MAKLSIKPGSTSVSLYLFIQDSSVTTGAGLTGLAFNTASLACYYVRPLGSATAVTLATLAAATSAWSSGGFKEVDATNMPGVYRLDVPDAVLAAGVRSAVVVLKGATNMAPCVLEISLSSQVDVTAWNGTTVSTPATAGIPDVNVKNINNTAAATPGASGGLLISGSNAGTTTLAALTVTGSFTVSDGLLVSRSTSNASAITATGNGTGNGIVATSGSGATGNGINATAASTNGHGFVVTATGTGNAFRAVSVSGDAILTTISTSGHGATFAGRGTTKHGINATGGATTSHGISATGGGVGHGILATSGSGATGDGIRAVAASTNGNGFNLLGVGTGRGLLTTGGATGQGATFAGGATSGAGITVTTTSGDGLSISPTAGHAISATANGTSKHGMILTGGTAGTSDGLSAVAGTGGVPIRGDITGNVTGNVSGSAGSVAGAVGSVTGNVGGNVVGSVASVVARVTANTDQLAGQTVTAAAGVTFPASVSSLTQTQVTGGAYALNSASFAFNAALDFTTTQKAATIARVTLTDTATTVTNQLTAAAIATGVWQDATAGDFTVANSVGKSLYNAFTANTSVYTVAALANAPTGGSAPTAAAIATAVWQDTTAGDFTVANSIGKSLYTAGNAPGAASGLALVGSDVGTATSVSGSVGSVTAGVTVTTNNDKTGYALTQTFPTNFASLGINASGHVSRVVLADTLTTYTGNTPQTGDSFARIGANGAGLTALGDTRIANLDAAVSSRSTLTQAQVTGGAYALNGASFAFNSGLDFTTTQKAATLARVTLTDTVSTYTGNTPQTGDSFARLGAPSGASVSADILTTNTRLTNTRAGYLDNLSAGAVATAAQVSGLAVNTRANLSVPVEIETPDTGTQIFKIRLHLFDVEGNMEAPDSTPTIALTNAAGTDRSSRLSVASNPSTGVYTWNYTATAGDAEEQLVWVFTVVEGGLSRTYPATSYVVEESAYRFTSTDRAALNTVVAQTDTIETRLPAALVSGRMDASVGAMASNTVTAAALAADAVAEIRDAITDVALNGTYLNTLAANYVDDGVLSATVTGVAGDVAGDVTGKVLGGGSGVITGTGARVVDAVGNAVAPASTALSTATWTNALAANLAATNTTVSTNLNATVSSRLAPTAAGRTLDVTATGAAGIDWGNVENQSTVVNLSATAVASAASVGEVQALVPGERLEIGVAVWGTLGRTLTGSDNLVLAKGTNITGFNDLSTAQVNAEVDTALTDVGLTTTVTGRIDAAVTSRMASYTQPTGFLAATFPATVASPTNITAGAVTTVGTVTNPVTVGANNDKTGYALTAAYDPAKTASQFNAAVDPVTLSSGSGSALVTATTAAVAAQVTSDHGSGSYARNTEPPAAATVAAAVWDLATAGHTAAGTFGAALTAAGSAGDPWITSLPGSYAEGTAGYLLGNQALQTGDSFARLGAPQHGSIAGDIAAVSAGGAADFNAPILAVNDPNSRLVDSAGNPVTSVSVAQALAALFVNLLGDRSGIQTRRITAALPGTANCTISATRTSASTIEATIVLPASP